MHNKPRYYHFHCMWNCHFVRLHLSLFLSLSHRWSWSLCYPWARFTTQSTSSTRVWWVNTPLGFYLDPVFLVINRGKQVPPESHHREHQSHKQHNSTKSHNMGNIASSFSSFGLFGQLVSTLCRTIFLFLVKEQIWVRCLAHTWLMKRGHRFIVNCSATE